MVKMTDTSYDLSLVHDLVANGFWGVPFMNMVLQVQGYPCWHDAELVTTGSQLQEDRYAGSE